MRRPGLVDEKCTCIGGRLARGVRLSFTHDHATAIASPRRDEPGRDGVTGERAHFSGMAL
jgi:hypothetical protein